MVADDEESFLYSTADLLRRAGYECDCALDAEVAAQMLEKSEYDLLIADIKMPGNPELEFIKDLPRLAEDLPVVIVTGYPSLRSAIQAIELPVVSYMVKPIDFNQLLEQVRVSVRKSRISRLVRNLRERLQDWRKNLLNIEEAIKHSSLDVSTIKIDTFCDLTFQNIVGALSDLNHLIDSSPNKAVEREICHLFNCPRLSELTEALREAIAVLEKTKSAFRSKDLGELRKKLEAIVEGKANEGLTKPYETHNR